MQPCMEFTHWRRGLSHTQGESRNPSLAQGSEAAALSSALRQQGVAVAADRPGRCCVLLCVRVCGVWSQVKKWQALNSKRYAEKRKYGYTQVRAAAAAVRAGAATAHSAQLTMSHSPGLDSAA